MFATAPQTLACTLYSSPSFVGLQYLTVLYCCFLLEDELPYAGKGSVMLSSRYSVKESPRAWAF